MSLFRASAPAAATAFGTFRSSFLSKASRSTVCSRCLRRARNNRYEILHNARFLATATAIRPQGLELHSPPRNADIPDTSIAGNHPNAAESNSPNVSLREGEAQKPQPTANAQSGGVAKPSPSPTDKKPRKSKLKARKAAMSLSPAAVEALKELLDQPEPKLIRVGVKNRGCSGLAYHLEYVDKPGAFDEAVEQDGVKVLIDSKALFSIIGSQMDYVKDKLSQRFVFINPNITESCGCGESFSVG